MGGTPKGCEVRKRGWQLTLFALGFLLVIPALWYWVWVWTSDPVRLSDTAVAFTRLAEVSLKRVQDERSIDLTFITPNDAVWRRIRRHWGDPGYVVVAAAPGDRDYVYCLKDLGINVRAMIGSTALDMETAEYAPYGYSSKCKPVGLLFRTAPDTAVRIQIMATNRITVSGDLVVEPYWTVGTKDRLVGISIQEDLHIQTVANALAVAGLILISVSASIFSRNRVRSVL